MRIHHPSDSLIWSTPRSSARNRVPYYHAMFREPWSRPAHVDHTRPRRLDPVALVFLAFGYSRYLPQTGCAPRPRRLRLCARPRDFFAKPKTGIAQDWSSPLGFDNGSLALLALRNRSWTSHSLQIKKRLLPLADTPFFHLLASPARIPVQHRNPN